MRTDKGPAMAFEYIRESSGESSGKTVLFVGVAGQDGAGRSQSVTGSGGHEQHATRSNYKDC